MAKTLKVKKVISPENKELRDYIAQKKSTNNLAKEEVKTLAKAKARRMNIYASKSFEVNFEKWWEQPLEVFRSTPIGLAQELISLYGKHIRYCRKGKTWFVYDGIKWDSDSEMILLSHAENLINGKLTAAEAMEDGKEKKAEVKKWEGWHDACRLEKIIKCAARPEVSILASGFETHPWLFNCPNGVIDLRTGDLLPHDKKLYLTLSSDVSYDPDAKCPTWKKFLKTACNGDKEMVAFLQRLLGYSLTSLTTEKSFVILLGPGSTGKSTFVETFRSILGEYAKNTGFKTFLATSQNAIREDLARLENARFVTAAEAGKGDSFDSSLMKQATGGDMITARFLFKGSSEYSPKFKIVLTSNQMPTIAADDNATWDRVIIIPFDVQIPREEWSEEFRQALKNERPGILAWAVRGAMRYFKEGRLVLPESIQYTISAKRAEADPIRAFIGSCCLRQPGAVTPTRTLHDAYVNWCDKIGKVAVDIDPFSKALNALGIPGSRKPYKVDGSKCKVRFDIVLKSSK